jgi:hypothetical protein
MKLAEREGFEPSEEVSPLTRLAGEHLRPLGHLSGRAYLKLMANPGPCSHKVYPIQNTWVKQMAEGVGFEPTDLPVCGFQDRCLKPLGHPSITYIF